MNEYNIIITFYLLFQFTSYDNPEDRAEEMYVDENDQTNTMEGSCVFYLFFLNSIFNLDFYSIHFLEIGVSQILNIC